MQYDADNNDSVCHGFFSAGPVPYYIVKNSWGTDFGLNGYVHVKAGGDTCGEPHYNIMSAYLGALQS